MTSIDSLLQNINSKNDNKLNDLIDYKTNDEDIYQYINSYDMDPVESTKEILFKIIENKNVNDILRFECAKSIYNNTSLLDPFHLLLNNITFSSTPTSLLCEICKSLLSSTDVNKHKEIDGKLNEVLLYIFSNTKLTSKYRYKIINDFEKLENVNKEYIYYIYTILYKDESDIKYHLLSIQFLLSRDEKNKKELQEMCAKHMKNKSLDENIRADAADILINFGNSDYILLAKQYLHELSGTNKFSTIYDNKQNAHENDIEKSVFKYVTEVLGIMSKPDVKWDSLCEQVISLCKDDKIKVQSSLSRISIDKVIYPAGQTLQTIFIKIWKIVESNKELQPRLIDELIDASGTCSTGFLTRIVNIMSGYGFELNIGFKAQIKANVNARLTKLIKEHKDGSLILDEMSSDRFSIDKEVITDDEKVDRIKNNKKNFDEFLRQNISKIYNELYLEFVGKRENNLNPVKGLYVNHEEFEMYFRDAISVFEGEC